MSNDDYVELSATFANKLGFVDNQTVLVNVIEKEIKKASEIIIQPNSEFDWENFKRYSAEIESNLLNQIKLVWSDLVVPVWPRPEICIYLKIHFKDKEQPLLRLETFTQLIGIVDEREIRQLQDAEQSNGGPVASNPSQTTNPANESTLATLFKFLPAMPNIKLTPKNQSAQVSTSESYVLPTLSKSNAILNVVNGSQLPAGEQPVDLNKLNTVFVNGAQFEAKHRDRSVGKLVRLLSPGEAAQRKELMNRKGAEKSRNDLNEENRYLETVVEINFVDQCPFGSLIPCNSLALQLDLYPFCKVVLGGVGQSSSLKMNSQKTDELSQQINHLNRTNQQSSSSSATNCLISMPVARNVTFSVYQTIPNLEQISSSISNFIKNYCIEHNFLVLNRSTLIRYGNFEFAFQPDFEQNDFLALTEQSVQSSLEIRVLSQLKARLKTSWNSELPRTNLDQIARRSITSAKSKDDQRSVYKFKNFQSVLDRCKEMIQQSLSCDGQQPADCINEPSAISNLVRNRVLLIHGKKGSGKSTLVQSLIGELNAERRTCSLVNLDCAKVKGKKIDLFKKTLLSTLNDAVYSQPCLLIIENLHVLLPKNSNVEQEHKLDLLYNQKVKLLLVDLIGSYLKESRFVYGSKLFVVMTSRSVDLFEDQNLELDLFDEILELKAPSPECSIQLINHLIRHKLKGYTVQLDQVDFSGLESILRTELADCQPLDLNLIAEQIINSSLLASDANVKTIRFSSDNYLEVFNDYVPFNLRSIKSRNKFRNKMLNDLGGLHEVKERLKQIIHWPIKYPALFKDYPIEPQTCVLLYGMPGTGKTCLAQALANEFKINLISIKGPEILSKYIGASEQAIRALFEKATLSKPCILFFDEFDAIVPPRQNNNTDVTDRIVNQILTQMDGIESLQEGIYIIAATSRPDMIDPALLRPGRFDVCLECGLPSLAERAQILSLLSEQVRLAEDVDLQAIASQTVGYTGSDLNTLIINATNQAINELITLDDELNVQNHEEIERSLSALKLNEAHFRLALESTSPSFSDREIEEYNKM